VAVAEKHLTAENAEFAENESVKRNHPDFTAQPPKVIRSCPCESAAKNLFSRRTLRSRRWFVCYRRNKSPSDCFITAPPTSVAVAEKHLTAENAEFAENESVKRNHPDFTAQPPKVIRSCPC